jgi:beta-lactamase superfamily II metal-dependent hydrolase
MELIRTFHPVGQGAFYTERHNFNGTDFTIVYDCGSTTLKGRKLERKIESTFPKDQQIDILFISHFHADHINGIEALAKHCKIKRVVMPFLDEDAKTLIRVNNLIDSNYSDTRLIDNPEDFFGDDIPIITINPAEIAQNDNGINLEGATEITTINTHRRDFESGTVFIPFSGIDWFFIPFNYKHDVRKNQFVKALKACGLTLKGIDTIDEINKHKSDIINAYKKVDGDLNTNSMILFSGKKSDDPVRCFQPYENFYFYRHHLHSGCLYMGDIDLNEPSIVKDINAKFKPLLPFIGTIQVPHHGSVHNFSASILQHEICCAIFSYGTTNKYGHPSDKVIGDVMANYIYPHFVTEEQTTIVIQWK